MLKKISIDKIKEAPYNPRVALTEEDRDYQKIKKSIETFGYVEPIVWNERTGHIVGGHQRFHILKSQGLQEIEVSVVNLKLAEEKQLNVALNKIRGEWDYQKLEQILKTFSVEEIEVTGFTADEVALVLEDEETFDFGDFDWEEPVKELGLSYIVDLKFESNEKARKWAEEHGLEDQIKPKTKTTVLRID